MTILFLSLLLLWYNYVTVLCTMTVLCTVTVLCIVTVRSTVTLYIIKNIINERGCDCCSRQSCSYSSSPPYFFMESRWELPDHSSTLLQSSENKTEVQISYILKTSLIQSNKNIIWYLEFILSLFLYEFKSLLLIHFFIDLLIPSMCRSVQGFRIFLSPGNLEGVHWHGQVVLTVLTVDFVAWTCDF